jgi:hypothetical protein
LADFEKVEPITEVKLSARHNTYRAVMDGRTYFLKAFNSATDYNHYIRESKALLRLRSIGHMVVLPEAVFEDEGNQYLQMPFYAQGTLHDWLLEQWKLPPAKRKSAEAMSERYRMVHRMFTILAAVHKLGVCCMLPFHSLSPDMFHALDCVYWT